MASSATLGARSARILPSLRQAPAAAFLATSWNTTAMPRPPGSPPPFATPGKLTASPRMPAPPVMPAPSPKAPPAPAVPAPSPGPPAPPGMPACSPGGPASSPGRLPAVSPGSPAPAPASPAPGSGASPRAKIPARSSSQRPTVSDNGSTGSPGPTVTPTPNACSPPDASAPYSRSAAPPPTTTIRSGRPPASPDTAWPAAPATLRSSAGGSLAADPRAAGISRGGCGHTAPAINMAPVCRSYARGGHAGATRGRRSGARPADGGHAQEHRRAAAGDAVRTRSGQAVLAGLPGVTAPGPPHRARWCVRDQVVRGGLGHHRGHHVAGARIGARRREVNQPVVPGPPAGAMRGAVLTALPLGHEHLHLAADQRVVLRPRDLGDQGGEPPVTLGDHVGGHLAVHGRGRRAGAL